MYMKCLIIIVTSVFLLISCNKKKISGQQECETPIENNPPCDLVHEIGHGFDFGYGDSLTPGANYRYHFTDGNDPNNDAISLAFMTKPSGEGEYLIVDTLTGENQVVIHKRYSNYYYQSVESGDYLYLRNGSIENWTNLTICNFNMKRQYDPAIISGFSLAKKVDAF